MYRIANDEDLFKGRLVIPCHNRATAEFYVKQCYKGVDEEDWEEYPVRGNYFVVYDAIKYAP